MPASVGKQTLTAVFPVLAASDAALRASIEAVAPELASKLTAAQSVHSARLALLSRRDGAGTLLLFETVFDGDAEAHLDELWRHGGAELSRVFSQCEGWGAAGDREQFGRFVAAYARPAAALFSAHAGLSVAQIRADSELRRGISRWLSDGNGELRGLEPVEIVRRVRERFGVTEATGGARSRGDALSFGEWVALGATYLRSCVHDVFDLLGGLWHDTLPPAETALLVASKDVGRSSWRAFSHVAEVKVGSFRRGALRFVLRVVAKLSRAASIAGKVPGVEAVHSARFMFLEDGRLIFLGDFDASVESTLARAAERARGLVGMIWSHTRGFPVSFGWYAGGARDTDKLRDFARAGELVTPFSYSGYPELGTREVRENAEIRRLLCGAGDEASARQLLSLVRD